jgi:hypothetical protein
MINESRNHHCSKVFVNTYIHLLLALRLLLEKVDPLRLDLRRVDCWQVALTARTDEPLHLLE